ncbi:MAG: helix-turn-helix domain-containing protein [Streptosporangiales bacterium]|nr:helix-turn-helix domain-containing protein [Streptosporangiales bacterium]
MSNDQAVEGGTDGPWRRTPIQAIDRTMALLDVTARAGAAGTSLKALTTAVGLHASTGRTLLASLVAHGLIRQDEGTRHYLLGSRFFDLNRAYLAQSDLSAVAAPVLKDLWEQTRETVHLAVLKDTQRVDIAVLVSPQLLNINPTTTQFTDKSAAPLFRTAAGKVLFAGLTDARRERMLDTAPWRDAVASGPGADSLRMLVDTVRRQGFATNLEEEAAGVCGVAAPVNDHTDQTVAALCVGYPAARRSRTLDESLRVAVVDAAAELSVLLGRA